MKLTIAFIALTATSAKTLTATAVDANTTLLGSDIATHTPAYLSVPDFKDCLGTKTIGTSQMLCMPKSMPQKCTEDSWGQLTAANSGFGSCEDNVPQMVGTNSSTYTPTGLPQERKIKGAVNATGTTAATDAGATTEATAGSIAPGTYHGTADKGIGCALGFCMARVHCEATAVTNADSTMNIKVKAQGKLPVDLNCPNEPYTLAADGAITLLNYPHTDASTGDCIKKALPAGIDLKTLKYDAEKKAIDMSVSAPLGIDIDINAAIQPADATAADSSASDKASQRSLRGIIRV